MTYKKNLIRFAVDTKIILVAGFYIWKLGVLILFYFITSNSITSKDNIGLLLKFWDAIKDFMG